MQSCDASAEVAGRPASIAVLPSADARDYVYGSLCIIPGRVLARSL